MTINMSEGNIKNCWEVMKCGRELKSARKVICPAVIAKEYNGKNRGKNAGRFCWVIAGTFCHDDVNGTHAQKIVNCIQCDFFKQVSEEEGDMFEFIPH